MALARAEQQANVTGPDGPRNAGLAIAHRRALEQQARNLVGHGFGLGGIGVAHDHANRLGTSRPVIDHRERIVLGIAKGIGPIGRLLDIDEDVVHKRQQFLHRAIAAGDGGARHPLRPQRLDEAARGIEHRHFGVAEAIDRLLPVSDDEDGGGDGAVGHAVAGGPRADQLTDQLPLRAAGVLELIHQYVFVARLEPVAAARELLHLPQQLQGAFEQVRKVEDTVLIEGPAVLILRNREQAADASRQYDVEVAPIRGDGRGHV